MSTALVRCPNCGSVSNQTSNPDEYVCSHCNARFKFVRPGDQVVTHDIRAHYCPECGGHVEAGKGLRCVRCGRTGLCDDCTLKSPNGYVCPSCAEQSQEDCTACGKYAIFQCNSCRNLRVPDPICACVEHQDQIFTIGTDAREEGDEFVGCTVFFFCPSCKSYVCPNCVVEKGIRWLSPSYHCRFCDSKLIHDVATKENRIKIATISLTTKNQ